MELARVRKYQKKHRLFWRLLAKSPVLVIGLNLPFLISASISLRAAAAISLEMLLIHMGVMASALVTCRVFPWRLRPMVSAAVSTLIMVFVRIMLIGMFRGIADTLGIYIYLMAINGMTMTHAVALTRKDKPFPVLVGAFMNVLGFSFVMFLASFFREYLGNGTLWGVPVAAPVKLSGMRVPFFGFIMMGFMLAGASLLGKALRRFSLNESVRREARFSVVKEER